MGGKRWTKEEDKKLREMLKAGYSREEVAAALGRGKSSVSYYCCLWKISTRKPIFSKEQTKELCKRYAEGATIVDLTKEFDRGVKAISTALQQNGVKLRGKRYRWSDDRCAELERLMLQGLNAAECAEKMHMVESAVDAQVRNSFGCCWPHAVELLKQEAEEK